MVGVCALKPVVVLLASGAGRENSVPWEETFEVVLGVDSENENEGVLETVGRGDADFLLADSIVSGRFRFRSEPIVKSASFFPLQSLVFASFGSIAQDFVYGPRVSFTVSSFVRVLGIATRRSRIERPPFAEPPPVL